jgi:cell division protein FtsQ
MRQRLAVVADADAVAAGLGFGIDQVTLSGHKFTFDRDVFDVLDRQRALTSFDAKAARITSSSCLVSTAELTRVYPDRLDVRIRSGRPTRYGLAANRPTSSMSPAVFSRH